MIFETHAHYDDEAFDDDRDTLLLSMQENGIGLIVNVGASLKSTTASIRLAEKYPFVYAAAGVHPNETAELNEESFAWLRDQCFHKKVVAVGEIGLDYYWDEPSHEIQKLWFARQLELARAVKKPVIIHSRDAAKDTYDMMAAHNADEIGGVVHCFSYSAEMAQEYVKMGFYIGVGGVVTFKNGKKLKEVVEAVPIERVLLETDSPYLSPEPNRGKRNTSLNIPYIIQKIAEIKEMSYDEVIAVTEENARRMYQIRTK
ncbi:MAG: TatD family hydrolase [Lachnospiraceae bacterium]|nr:TatD family hydrolase [Lachnospiraceae bacterium]